MTQNIVIICELKNYFTRPQWVFVGTSDECHKDAWTATNADRDSMDVLLDYITTEHADTWKLVVGDALLELGLDRIVSMMAEGHLVEEVVWDMALDWLEESRDGDSIDFYGLRFEFMEDLDY